MRDNAALSRQLTATDRLHSTRSGLGSNQPTPSHLIGVARGDRPGLARFRPKQGPQTGSDGKSSISVPHAYIPFPIQQSQVDRSRSRLRRARGGGLVSFLRLGMFGRAHFNFHIHMVVVGTSLPKRDRIGRTL
jgi:hypothetical protein